MENKTALPQNTEYRSVVSYSHSTSGLVSGYRLTGEWIKTASHHITLIYNTLTHTYNILTHTHTHTYSHTDNTLMHTNTHIHDRNITHTTHTHT